MADERHHRDALADPPVAAPRPHKRRGVAIRLIAYPLILYGTYCTMLGCIQDRMIFPRDMTPPPLKWPPVEGTVEWERDRADGSKGVAWFVPAPDAGATNPSPCVVFFHGNAEIIDHQMDIMNGYRMLGCSVLLPEFPGYGRSEGTPSERSIVDDGLFFVKKLADEPSVDRRRIFIHGGSIGGGAAVQIAGRHEPAGLILESSFTSLASFADAYFVPRFLVRHPFYSDRIIKTLKLPILIFHGKRDTIIPVAHGRALRDMAAQSTDVRYVEYDCGHNDFPPRADEADYWRNIEAFLKAQAASATNE